MKSQIKIKIRDNIILNKKTGLSSLFSIEFTFPCPDKLLKRQQLFKFVF